MTACCHFREQHILSGGSTFENHLLFGNPRPTLTSKKRQLLANARYHAINKSVWNLDWTLEQRIKYRELNTAHLTVEAFRVCATRFFKDWTASSSACFSADHDDCSVLTSGLASDRSWGGVDTALTSDWIVSASVWRLSRRPWRAESMRLANFVNIR